MFLNKNLIRTKNLITDLMWVEMMLVTDTIEAARHAVSNGWILEEDIGQIVEEKREDESDTGLYNGHEKV